MIDEIEHNFINRSFSIKADLSAYDIFTHLEYSAFGIEIGQITSDNA